MKYQLQLQNQYLFYTLKPKFRSGLAEQNHAALMVDDPATVIIKDIDF